MLNCLLLFVSKSLLQFAVLLSVRVVLVEIGIDDEAVVPKLESVAKILAVMGIDFEDFFSFTLISILPILVRRESFELLSSQGHRLVQVATVLKE